MAEKITPLRPKKEDAIDSGPFVCGDVVVLASGGPAMTVRSAISGSMGMLIKVDYFDGEANLATAEFYVAQLQKFVMPELAFVSEAETVQ